MAFYFYDTLTYPHRNSQIIHIVKSAYLGLALNLSQLLEHDSDDPSFYESQLLHSLPTNFHILIQLTRIILLKILLFFIFIFKIFLCVLGFI